MPLCETGLGFNNGLCYGTTTATATCQWVQKDGKISCTVDDLLVSSPSKVKVFNHLSKQPDIMAPVNACTVEDHGLNCTLEELKVPYGAIVNFVTAEGDYVGGVDGMSTNRVVVNNACNLENCGPVVHQGHNYDHFSCQCSGGDSSVA